MNLNEQYIFVTFQPRQVFWLFILVSILIHNCTFEPPHDKTNKVAYAPGEDSYQSGHQPSLIRVLAVRFMDSLGPKLSSGEQQRL